MHSTDFQDLSMAEGKRVIVVGNGKSAVDCAVEATKATGAKVTLVGRRLPQASVTILAEKIFLFFSIFTGFDVLVNVAKLVTSCQRLKLSNATPTTYNNNNNKVAALLI